MIFAATADFCCRKPEYCRLPNPCGEPPFFGGSNPTQHTYLTKNHPRGVVFIKSWLRGVDLNH